MGYIICFTSSTLIGDKHNALGVARTFQALHSDMGRAMEIREYPASEAGAEQAEAFIRSLDGAPVEESAPEASQASTFREKIQPRSVERSSADARVVVIGAGEDGLLPLQTLKRQYGERVFTAWSGHQLPDQAGRDTLGLLDQVALPRGTVSATTRVSLRGALVETIGVPHNLTQRDIDAEAQKWADRLPKPSSKNMLVVLGGDAPDSNGKQHFYTASEATRLAGYVASLAKRDGYFVYVTNGPRTGKYDHTRSDASDQSAATEILTAHRLDGPITTPSDAVSDAFVTALQEKGWRDYHFSDFRWGAAGAASISTYKPLLQRADLAMMPGESVSMVSEASDFVNEVMVYETGSMNPTHHASLAALGRTRRIDILDENMHCTPSPLPRITSKPAALEVAEQIQHNLSLKQQHDMTSR